jgi:anti-anti-sigma regulatory factor
MRTDTAKRRVETETLSVHISKESGFDIVHPFGTIDASTRNVLFCRCLAHGRHHVVVDLADVGFLDRDGLAGLLAARRVLESEGGSLSIRHASGQPAQLLNLSSSADAEQAIDLPDLPELSSPTMALRDARTGHTPQRKWSTPCQ